MSLMLNGSSVCFKERPILFSSSMVQALLDGRKTQTRRIIKPQPNQCLVCGKLPINWDKDCLDGGSHESINYNCPFGNIGEQLWVRETFAFGGAAEKCQPGNINLVTQEHWLNNNYLWYRADGESPCLGETIGEIMAGRGRWRPSIHMPRWASRISLIITGIRVERLQNISAADAIAEGLKAISKDGTSIKYGIPDRDGYPGTDNFGWDWQDWDSDPVKAYKHLWDTISGSDSWNKNPFVWVIEFRIIK